MGPHHSQVIVYKLRLRSCSFVCFLLNSAAAVITSTKSVPVQGGILSACSQPIFFYLGYSADAGKVDTDMGVCALCRGQIKCFHMHPTSNSGRTTVSTILWRS